MMSIPSEKGVSYRLHAEKSGSFRVGLVFSSTASASRMPKSPTKSARSTPSLPNRALPNCWPPSVVAK